MKAAKQTWLISDTHYGHKMLVANNYRPANFEELMLKRLLKMLRPGDNLINLGDWYMSGAGKALAIEHLKVVKERIGNGTTTLIRGNHDPDSFYKYAELGWGSVVDGIMLRSHGQRLYLTHKPEPPMYHSDGKQVWDKNIHGHLHGNNHREGFDDGLHIEISQELLDYYPVSLDTVVKLGETPVRRKDGKIIGIKNA